MVSKLLNWSRSPVLHLTLVVPRRLRTLLLLHKRNEGGIKKAKVCSLPMSDMREWVSPRNTHQSHTNINLNQRNDNCKNIHLMYSPNASISLCNSVCKWENLITSSSACTEKYNSTFQHNFSLQNLWWWPCRQSLQIRQKHLSLSLSFITSYNQASTPWT